MTPPDDEDVDHEGFAGCALLMLVVTFLLALGVTCGLLAGCALPPPPVEYTRQRACERLCAIHGDDGRVVEGELRCECTTMGGIEWTP